MNHLLPTRLGVALLLASLGACGESPSPPAPAVGGPWVVTAVGYDTGDAERAVQGFAKIMGTDLEDARCRVEGLDETKQIIGLGLTKEESERLEALLEECGLQAMVGSLDEPGQGESVRALGVGWPKGLSPVSSGDERE